jgi:hypothetical protein
VRTSIPQSEHWLISRPSSVPVLQLARGADYGQKPLARIAAHACIAALLLSCASAPATPSIRDASPAPGSARANPLEPEDEAAVRAAAARRADAIARGDKALYMSLLAPGDPAFLLEQSRWFDYRLATEIAELSVKVQSIEAEGLDECVATISQSYRIGPSRDYRAYTYAQRYRRVGGAWLDADLDFAVLETDHFSVRYAPELGSSRAYAIAAEAERAWASVRAAYGATPAGKTIVKLFADRELLRQNSKITIGFLFTGWGEPGESIKLWARPDQGYSFAPTLAHEIVHKVTLETSKNQCYWFAEGLANHFGNFEIRSGGHLDKSTLLGGGRPWSLAYLGSINPETPQDGVDLRLYGPAAGTVIKFITDRFGQGAPRAVIEALASYPQIEEGFVYEKHDERCRGYLDGAFKDALGVDTAALDAAWLAWMGAGQ